MGDKLTVKVEPVSPKKQPTAPKELKTVKQEKISPKAEATNKKPIVATPAPPKSSITPKSVVDQPSTSKNTVANDDKPSTSTASVPRPPHRVVKVQAVLTPGTKTYRGAASVVSTGVRKPPAFYEKYPHLNPTAGPSTPQSTPTARPQSLQQSYMQKLQSGGLPVRASGPAPFNHGKTNLTAGTKSATTTPGNYRDLAQPISVTKMISTYIRPTGGATPLATPVVIKGGVKVTTPATSEVDKKLDEAREKPSGDAEPLKKWKRPWDKMTEEEREEQRRLDAEELKRLDREDQLNRSRPTPTTYTPTLSTKRLSDEMVRKFQETARRNEEKWKAAREKDANPAADVLNEVMRPLRIKDRKDYSMYKPFTPSPPQAPVQKYTPPTLLPKRQPFDPFAPPPPKKEKVKSVPVKKEVTKTPEKSAEKDKEPLEKTGDADVENVGNDNFDINDDAMNDIDDAPANSINDTTKTPSKTVKVKKEGDKSKKELDPRLQQLLKPSMKDIYTEEMAALAKEKEKFELELINKMSKDKSEKLPALPSLSQLQKLKNKPDELKESMDRLVRNMKKIGDKEDASSTPDGELTKHLNKMMDTMTKEVFLGTVRTEVYEAEDNMFVDAATNYIKNSTMTTLSKDDFERSQMLTKIAKAKKEQSRRMYERSRELKRSRRHLTVDPSAKITKAKLAKVEHAQRLRRSLFAPTTPPGSPPSGSPPVSIVGSRDASPERVPSPVTPPGSPPPPGEKSKRKSAAMGKKAFQAELDESSEESDVEPELNQELKEYTTKEKIRERHLKEMKTKYDWAMYRYQSTEHQQGRTPTLLQENLPAELRNKELDKWMYAKQLETPKEGNKPRRYRHHPIDVAKDKDLSQWTSKMHKDEEFDSDRMRRVMNKSAVEMDQMLSYTFTDEDFALPAWETPSTSRTPAILARNRQRRSGEFGSLPSSASLKFTMSNLKSRLVESSDEEEEDEESELSKSMSSLRAQRTMELNKSARASVPNPKDLMSDEQLEARIKEANAIFDDLNHIRNFNGLPDNEKDHHINVAVKKASACLSSLEIALRREQYVPYSTTGTSSSSATTPTAVAGVIKGNSVQIKKITAHMAKLWQDTDQSPAYIKDMARGSLPTTDALKANSVLALRSKIVGLERRKAIYQAPVLTPVQTIKHLSADNQAITYGDLAKRLKNLPRESGDAKRTQRMMKEIEERDAAKKERQNRERAVLGGVIVRLQQGETLSKHMKRLPEDASSTLKRVLIRKDLSSKVRESLILAEFYEVLNAKNNSKSKMKPSEGISRIGNIDLPGTSKDGELVPTDEDPAQQIENMEPQVKSAYSRWRSRRPQLRYVRLSTGNLVDEIELEEVELPEELDDSAVDPMPVLTEEQAKKVSSMDTKFFAKKLLKADSTKTSPPSAIDPRTGKPMPIIARNLEPIRMPERRKTLEEARRKVMLDRLSGDHVRVMRLRIPADDVRDVMNDLLKQICGDDEPNADVLLASDGNAVPITSTPKSAIAQRTIAVTKRAPPSILRSVVGDKNKTIMWKPASTTPASATPRSTKSAQKKDDVREVMDDLLRRVCGDEPKRQIVLRPALTSSASARKAPFASKFTPKPVFRLPVKLILPSPRTRPAPAAPDLRKKKTDVEEVLEDVLKIVCSQNPDPIKSDIHRRYYRKKPTYVPAKIVEEMVLDNFLDANFTASDPDSDIVELEEDEEGASRRAKFGESSGRVKVLQKKSRKQSFKALADSDDEDEEEESTRRGKATDGTPSLRESLKLARKAEEDENIKKFQQKKISSGIEAVKREREIAERTAEIVANSKPRNFPLSRPVTKETPKLDWVKCMRLVEEQGEKEQSQSKMKQMKKKMRTIATKWMAVDEDTSRKMDAKNNEEKDKGEGEGETSILKSSRGNEKRFFTTRAGKRIVLRPKGAVAAEKKAPSTPAKTTAYLGVVPGAVHVKSTPAGTKAGKSPELSATRTSQRGQVRWRPEGMPQLSKSNGADEEISEVSTVSKRVLEKRELRKRRADDSPERPPDLGPAKYRIKESANGKQTPAKSAILSRSKGSATSPSKAALAKNFQVESASMQQWEEELKRRAERRRLWEEEDAKRLEKQKQQEWAMRKNEATIDRQKEQVEIQKKLLGEIRKEMVKTFENASQTNKLVEKTRRAMYGECHDFAEYRKLVDAREKLMNTLYEQTMEKMKTQVATEETRRQQFENFKKKAIKREKALIKEIENTNSQLEKEQGKLTASGLPMKAPTCAVPYTKATVRSKLNRFNYVLEATKRVLGEGVEADKELERDQVKAIIDRLQRKYGIESSMSVDQDRDFCTQHEIGYRKRIHMKKFLAKLGLDFFCSQRSFDKLRRELGEVDVVDEDDEEYAIKREKRPKKEKKPIDPRKISLGRGGEEEESEEDEVEEIILDDDYNLNDGGETSGNERKAVDRRYNMARFANTQMLTTDEEYIEDSDQDRPGPSNRYVPLPSGYAPTSRSVLPPSTQSHYLHGPPILHAQGKAIQQRPVSNQQVRRGGGGAKIRGGHR